MNNIDLLVGLLKKIELVSDQSSWKVQIHSSMERLDFLSFFIICAPNGKMIPLSKALNLFLPFFLSISLLVYIQAYFGEKFCDRFLVKKRIIFRVKFMIEWIILEEVLIISEIATSTLINSNQFWLTNLIPTRRKNLRY